MSRLPLDSLSDVRPDTAADAGDEGVTPLPVEEVLPGFVGRSEAVRELGRLVRRLAPLETTVLLEGESGTGKELAARALHRLSGRQGPFVTVNCGALARELLESELFGHVRGAFTGAHQAREGLFAHARGGTLFLDEIGELPLAMQPRLLRAIEAHRVRPVGADEEVPVDARIVVATNRCLADEVAAGRFREDLYYRLAVVTLELPPLRERPEDIPLLVRHFVDGLVRKLDLPPPQVHEADLLRLMDHPWPGNVRELRNLVERCLLLGLTPGECLVPGGARPEEDADDLRLATLVKRHILRVLRLENGNKSAAARRLGIGRKTLERKLREWEGR